MEDEQIPSQEQYRETCTKLLEEEHMNTLIAVRMGCEMGMTRLEVVNAKVSNLDIKYARCLWVDIAKKVRKGYKKEKTISGKKIPKYEMRSRNLPINPSLYQVLIKYIEDEQVYILRHKNKVGDWKKSFDVHYINALYKRHGVSWTTHASRHFFKNAIIDWMRKNRQMDHEVIKSLMGHSRSGGHEQYGSISWNYRKEVIDNTFDNMLVYGEEKYEKSVACLSSTLDIPIDKIKFLYEVFIHNGNKFPHN